jgi:GntR family transcriptional regulator
VIVVEFGVDRADGLPAYLQIVRQVREALRLGRLLPGDRLPTVRQGAGTFVTASLGSVAPADMARLRGELARWVVDARTAGLEHEDLQALLGAVLTEGQGNRT